jgi:hypothetical protein
VRSHQWNEHLAQPERAIDVRFHRRAEGLKVHLKHAASLVRIGGGIVDQHVNLTELSADKCEQRADARVIGHIELVELDSGTTSAQLCRGLVPLHGITLGEYDAQADSAELSADLKADATIPSGDQSDPLRKGLRDLLPRHGAPRDGPFSIVFAVSLR